MNKEEREKISKSRLIIKVLMTGETLSLKEIAEKLSEASGDVVKITDISTFLSKMSDWRKCDLGYLIEKKKDGNRHVYKLADDALALSEEQAYGLFLRKGKNKYTTDALLRDFPSLKTYFGESKKVISAQEKTAKTITAEVRIGKTPMPGKKIEEMIAGMIRKISDLPSCRDIEELKVKIDRIEKAITNLEKKQPDKALIAPNKENNPNGETATDIVLHTIKKVKGGIRFPDIRKITKFDDKKIRNVISYLKKNEKIRTVSRGVYESV